jgi:hypothetical protein
VATVCPSENRGRLGAIMGEGFRTDAENNGVSRSRPGRHGTASQMAFSDPAGARAIGRAVNLSVFLHRLHARPQTCSNCKQIRRSAAVGRFFPTSFRNTSTQESTTLPQNRSNN